MSDRVACRSCKKSLPASAFNRDTSKATGLQSLCRDCHRALRPRHVAKDSARGARFRVENPAKRAAHRAVESAILRGDMVRPSECARCAKPARLDAHHTDYDRPLEVTWLCRGCHGAVHREEAARA